MSQSVCVRSATATISKSALKHNYKYAKSLAPNSKTVAVIKANAYGNIYI